MSGAPETVLIPDGSWSRSGGKDVTKLAGVSTATVSRVLNNPERVDPQTRHRVLEAAAKLRYLPHGAARSLRSQRSKMIGAMMACRKAGVAAASARSRRRPRPPGG